MRAGLNAKLMPSQLSLLQLSWSTKSPSLKVDLKLNSMCGSGLYVQIAGVVNNVLAHNTT